MTWEQAKTRAESLNRLFRDGCIAVDSEDCDTVHYGPFEFVTGRVGRPRRDVRQIYLRSVIFEEGDSEAADPFVRFKFYRFVEVSR